MKKLVAIALLFFYLPAISGVAIRAHYCCGKIASVKIQLAAKDYGHHSSSKDKNCCNDISHFFRIHAPQQISVSNISFKAPVLSIPAFTSVINFIFFSNEECVPINGNFLHSPPLGTTQPLFLYNSVFLI